MVTHSSASPKNSTRLASLIFLAAFSMASCLAISAVTLSSLLTRSDFDGVAAASGAAPFSLLNFIAIGCPFAVDDLVCQLDVVAVAPVLEALAVTHALALAVR